MANLAFVPVKDALTAFLKATMTAAYGKPVDVQEAGNTDFDDNGQLVLHKVSVRVRFAGGEFTEVRDITRTTLGATYPFQIICLHESLRGEKERRDRTLELAATAIALLAGTRLVLPDETRSEPILVRSIDRVSDGYGPVNDCWGVSIEVGGFAQFDGRYANGYSAQDGAL